MTDFEVLDLDNPHPCIYDLFAYYNQIYFEGKLGACSLTWSTKRMTLCAGVCRYSTHGGCEIRLSEPLLKFRPVSDLKNTLLHEMIHAYLFLTNGNKDHDDHGPCFQDIMTMINNCYLEDVERPDDGYAITIYHNFTDEVDLYRVHQWRCIRCADLIKRAMNRTPSVSDCLIRADSCSHPRCHWHMHQQSCGGSYEKIHEPAGYIDKRKQVATLASDDSSAQNNQSVDKGGAKLTIDGQKRKKVITNGGVSKKATKGSPVQVKVASLDDYFCTVKKDNGMTTYTQAPAAEKDAFDEETIEGRSMTPPRDFSIAEQNGKRKLCFSDAAAQKVSTSLKTEEAKGVKIEIQSSRVEEGEGGSLLQNAVTSEVKESSDKIVDIDVSNTLACKRTSLHREGKETIFSTSFRRHRAGKENSGICCSPSSRKRHKPADQLRENQVCKEPLVILAWANWVSYESDEESEEPLVNKRTERRKQGKDCSELLDKGKTVLDQSENAGLIAGKLQSKSEYPMETRSDYTLDHKLQDDTVSYVEIINEDEEKLSGKVFDTKKEDIVIELSDDEDGTEDKGNCAKEVAPNSHCFFPQQALLGQKDLEAEGPCQDVFMQRTEASKSKMSVSFGNSVHGRAPSTTTADVMICPICSLTFQSNERNAAVNKHIDECLGNYS